MVSFPHSKNFQLLAMPAKCCLALYKTGCTFLPRKIFLAVCLSSHTYRFRFIVAGRKLRAVAHPHPPPPTVVFRLSRLKGAELVVSGATVWKGDFSSNTKNYKIMPDVVYKISPLCKYFALFKEQITSTDQLSCQATHLFCLQGAGSYITELALQLGRLPRPGGEVRGALFHPGYPKA